MSGRKLAAFDALFRRDVRNRTVARSALRGFALGLALTALLLLPVFVLPESFGRPAASLSVTFWSIESSPFPAVSLVLFVLTFTLFTELCEKTRSDAYEMMLRHAEQLGANAVIGIRYDATEVMQGVSEVLCYGTAVVVQSE